MLQVSGVVDRVYALGGGGEQREGVLAQAEAAAKEQAVQAGADPDTCQVGLTDVPTALSEGGRLDLRALPPSEIFKCECICIGQKTRIRHLCDHTPICQR